MGRIEKLKEFIAVNPDDPFLRHALALEHIKTGNDAEARSLFEEILEKNPDYIGTYYHLARLLERNGDTAQARAWYIKGIGAATAAGDKHALGELQMALEDLDD